MARGCGSVILPAVPAHGRETQTTTIVNRWTSPEPCDGPQDVNRSWIWRVGTERRPGTETGNEISAEGGRIELFQPSPLPGVVDGFVPVFDLECFQNIMHMVFHRVHRE